MFLLRHTVCRLTSKHPTIFSVKHRQSAVQSNRSSSSGPDTGAASLTDILRSKFPKATTIEVVDISGGCGAMYEVIVESVDFKGLSVVKQHRLINEALKENIKQMHGLRIQTGVPVNLR